MSGENFQIVKSKKSRKIKQPKTVVIESSSEIDIDKVLKKIENIKIDLVNSGFVKNSLKKLKEAIKSKVIDEVICLGIGRVSDCIISQHQLAFLLIIQEELRIKSKFYDPVITQHDIDILTKLNCEILSENKEGKYSIQDKSTLFYLPHCPKQITNNLLYSNWNDKSLKNLILICNSFNTIITSTPERLLRPNAHYLIEIHPFTKEIELENSYKFTDIFNDFAIHTFENFSAVPNRFWENCFEPVYSSEDLEFVKNGGN